MRVIVVNPRAGTARQFSREGLVRLIHDQCRAAGIADYEVLLASPRRIDAVLRLAAARTDELWVGGGDGTLRTAARYLAGTGKVFGVLPFGTMNLLARDLGIPLDPELAIRALAEAPVDRIDIGRINGMPFLNKSALGLYPEMIIDRERRRRLFGYGKWPAMLRAAWRALRRHRTMRVTLEVDGVRREIESPALVVATNGYEFRAGRLFRRPDLASGELTLYVSHARDWLGSIGQVARLFLGTLHADPELEILRSRAITIEFERTRPIANDGEVDFLGGPIRYAIDPRALTVRYPGRDTAV